MVIQWRWILIGTVFITSEVVACLFVGPNKLVILFPPNVQLDTRLIKEFCTPKSCEVDGGTILYQSVHEPRAGVLINERSVKYHTISLSLPQNYRHPDKFEWSTAISSELKRLVSVGALSEISYKDISAIERVAESSEGKHWGDLYYLPQLYYRPDGCGRSEDYLEYRGSDPEKSGWLTMPGSCKIEGFGRSKRNCPDIGCYRCGGNEFISSVPKAPLDLTR